MPRNGKKLAGKAHKQIRPSSGFLAYIPAVIVVVLGVMLSIAAFAMVRHWEVGRLRTHFDRATSDRIALLKHEIESNLFVLESVRSFFGASIEVEREEFNIFVKPPLAHLSSIQAIGWAPRVPHSNRTIFEMQRRDEGFSKFKISSLDSTGKLIDAADRPEYFPFDFVEPSAASRVLHGLDLASIPTCHQAMLRALDSGKTITTSRLELMGPSNREYKIMIFGPIYKKGTNPATQQSRQEQLEGFVVGLFRISDILQRALSYLVHQAIDVYLYEDTESTENRFLELYHVPGSDKPDMTGKDEFSRARSAMTYQAKIDMPGRQWQIVFSATDQYIRSKITFQRWVVLAMGLLLTALLATYFITSISRTSRIEQLVHKRTIELRETNEQLNQKIIEIRKFNKRQWADEALRQERDFAEGLIETAQAIVLVLDVQARIVRFNPYMEKISGYRLEEVRDKNWFKTFLPESDHERIKKIFSQALDNIPTKGNVNPIVTKDGRQRQIEWYSKTLKDADGKTVGLLAIGQDITDRKLAEERLARSESLYRKAIENARGIPYQYRWSDYKYVFIGSGVKELFGIDPEELTDERYQEMVKESVIVFPAEDKDFSAYQKAIKHGNYDEAAPHRQAFQKRIERGQIERCQVDYCIHTAKGRVKWISDYWVPARDEITHQVTGSIGIMLDITERKRIEQEIIDLNENLKAKNKELEKLVYAISHDLRSPLVNIQGFSKELTLACDRILTVLKQHKHKFEGPLQELQKLLADEIPEAIQYIHAGADKMNSLLTAILRLSRLGRSDLTLKPLDMNQMINDISRSMEFQLKEAGLKFKTDILPSCLGDPSQINQLFSNLIDNAIKYRHPDREGLISISGRLTGDRVIYCVRDNGTGIDDEHKDKVFELFHRVDASDTEGEGIGLTIVRRIVDRHNGKIWVESTLGQGSEFFVALAKPKKHI